MGSFKLHDLGDKLDEPGLHTIISAAFTYRKSTVDAWSIEYMLTQTGKWKLLWNRLKLEAGLKWADRDRPWHWETVNQPIGKQYLPEGVCLYCMCASMSAWQRWKRTGACDLLEKNESQIFFCDSLRGKKKFCFPQCVGLHPNRCTSNNIEAEVFTSPQNYTHILTHCLRWSDFNHHNCGHTSSCVKYGIFVALLLLHVFF